MLSNNIIKEAKKVFLLGTKVQSLIVSNESFFVSSYPEHFFEGKYDGIKCTDENGLTRILVDEDGKFATILKPAPHI